MTNDKRIAETREKLRNALTELLLTEPMESISIRMITDKAGVNRSTFYAHYTCQRDLIDEMEEELLSHLPVFSSSAHDDIAKTFTAFMSYVKEKRDIVKILMTEGVDNSFGERLIKIVMDRYEEFSPFEDEELSRMNYVFCINGIVFPDRSLKPQSREMAKVYQNVDFVDFDSIAKTVRIANGFFFTDLEKYDFSYLIKQNGKVVYEGELDVKCAPMDTVQVSLQGFPAQAPGDTYVEFYVKQREAEPFLPSGYVIAREQKLAYSAPYETATLTSSLKAQENGNLVNFKGKNFTITFDKTSGLMTSYIFRGQQFILGMKGPKPDFWRAPVENDYGNGSPRRLKAWREVSDATPKAASFAVDGNKVTVEYAYETIKANWKAVYTISDDGKVRIENTFTSQLEEPKDERRGRRPSTDGNWIPRVGMSMQLPVSFDNLTYYGCGPYENYVDRRSSTFVDEYETQVSDMFVPYIRPEENEHRTNVRWLALSGKGKGLLIVADDRIEFNASNYPRNEFDCGDDIRNGAPVYPGQQKKHNSDPRKQELVELFVDCGMTGVGGDNSWGAQPHEWDQMKIGQTYNYAFTLVPYTKNFKSLLKKYE